jgi:FkbM family methyltransferase
MDIMNRWLTSTVEAYKLNFGYTDHPIVWDVGSRDGDDGVELAERIFTGNADVALQNSFVVCVEPNPPQAQLIRERYPSVVVYETAVSDYEGKSQFVRVISDNKDAVGMSSLDVANQDTKGKGPKEVIKVEVTTLEKLMDDELIDVMKIDCEGYSWEVLHGMGEKLA